MIGFKTVKQIAETNLWSIRVCVQSAKSSASHNDLFGCLHLQSDNNDDDDDHDKTLWIKIAQGLFPHSAL